MPAARPVVLDPDGPEDPSIRYAVVWKQPAGILARLPNLEAIFSIGAGVDHIFAHGDVPDVPVVRIVAPNLAQYMTEYVVWRVLDHLRQGSAYRIQQQRRIWHERPQPPADAVSVGIMGLGQLGRASARALLALGSGHGWSRSAQTMDGAFSTGPEGLTIPERDDSAVLLPHTPATEGIVYALPDALRRDNAMGGACLINAGRGKLQREADILRALDAGILREASLDVFEHEPLDEASPLWTHPRVFITPHAAATSDPAHLVPPMLEQMDAHERGEPLDNLVDRIAGY